jgi:hypothetical protein
MQTTTAVSDGAWLGWVCGGGRGARRRTLEAHDAARDTSGVKAERDSSAARRQAELSHAMAAVRRTDREWSQHSLSGQALARAPHASWLDALAAGVCANAAVCRRSPAEAVVHPACYCDGCGANPLEGSRFKCAVCPNYDLCEHCYAINAHGVHAFLRLRAPSSRAELLGARRGSQAAQSARILLLSNPELAGLRALAVATGTRADELLGLDSLDLTGRPLGDSELIAAGLGALARWSERLASLELGSTRVGDRAARALGAALKANHKTALVTLSLSANLVGDVGASRLGEGLKANRTLATLNLQDNLLSDEGTRALAEALGAATREGLVLST